MIVPHLSDKIKKSFSLYCQDFSDSPCPIEFALLCKFTIHFHLIINGYCNR